MDTNATNRLMAAAYAAAQKGLSDGAALAIANLLDALSGSGSGLGQAKPSAADGVVPIPFKRGGRGGSKSPKGGPANVPAVMARLHRGRASAASAAFRALPEPKRVEAIEASLGANRGADVETVAAFVLKNFTAPAAPSKRKRGAAPKAKRKTARKATKAAPKKAPEPAAAAPTA